MTYPQTNTVESVGAFPGMDGGGAVGTSPTDPAFNEEASAEIRDGIFVKRGTKADGALLLTATSNVLLGVTMHSHKRAPGVQLGDDGVLPAGTLNVRKVGRAWVRVEAAISLAEVAAGAEVHIRAVAAGAEIAGACRKDADGTDCIDASGWAQWLTPTQTDPDGNLTAMLEFDIRNWRA